MFLVLQMMDIEWIQTDFQRFDILTFAIRVQVEESMFRMKTRILFYPCSFHLH